MLAALYDGLSNLNFEGLDIAKFSLGEINNAIENQRKSVSLKTIIDMSL